MVKMEDLRTMTPDQLESFLKDYDPEPVDNE